MKGMRAPKTKGTETIKNDTSNKEKKQRTYTGGSAKGTEAPERERHGGNRERNERKSKGLTSGSVKGTWAPMSKGTETTDNDTSNT